jgi:predicted nucleic acid-binding protein
VSVTAPAVVFDTNILVAAGLQARQRLHTLRHAASATLISNDDHLLSCGDVLPVTVLTAGAFWEMLRRSRTASGS